MTEQPACQMKPRGLAREIRGIHGECREPGSIAGARRGGGAVKMEPAAGISAW
jgi:hypothetical protein